MAHAYAFDTLGYARKLESAGVERVQAEAHAEAPREFILSEVATKGDIEELRREIAQEGKDIRAEMKSEILGAVIRIGGFNTALLAAAGVIYKMFSN